MLKLPERTHGPTDRVPPARLEANVMSELDPRTALLIGDVLVRREIAPRAAEVLPAE